MLAVEVSYTEQQAIVGTEKGAEVPKAEILAALEKIRCRGTIVDE